MFLAETLSRLELDALTRRERPLVVVLVDLDHTLAKLPAAEFGDLLGGDGVLALWDLFALDVEDVLRFRMQQAGLKSRDLEPFIGGRSRVSEVLTGKRPLSLDMIRALHKNLGIPAQSLIGPEVVEGFVDLREPSASALQLLRDRKFIGSNESFAAYLDRVFGVGEVAACWQKSRTERTSAKTDQAALTGWLAAVRILADQVKVPNAKRPAAEALGRRIAKLSVKPDGPQRAKAELARLGIILITLEHLPGTYLEGAALCRNDGIPCLNAERTLTSFRPFSVTLERADGRRC